MTRVAAHIAAWGDRWPGAYLSPNRSSWTAGTPILESQFADLRLVVEVAWGGGPTGDPGSWTDITDDVESPVGITVGKADEASRTQPAQFSVLLNNPGGRYNKGPQSPNWPYIRRAVPVRARAVLDGVPYTRFYGYANGFTPVWIADDEHPQAILSASGRLRRLGRSQPLRSVFYRSYALGDSPALTPAAYWPCEDGANATSIASGLQGGSAMVLTGAARPTFARDSSFPCSAPLPQLSTSIWTGAVPAHTGAGANVLRLLLSIPAGGSVDGAVIARMYTTGLVARLDLRYSTTFGGALAFTGYDAGGNQILTSPYVAPGVGGYAGGFNGLPTFVSMELVTSGANITYTLIHEPLVAVAGSFGVAFQLWSNTLSTATLGNATQIVINPDGTVTDTAVGHVIYQPAYDFLANTSFQLNGWPSESATDRLVRLAAEQGESIDVAPGNTFMGPQGIGKYIDLLRDAELADGGVLFDGFGPGLSYIPRVARQNQPAALTLDATADLPGQPIEPVDDDQLIVNSFTATRTGGSSVTVSDTTSSMSVDSIGEYSDGWTVNLSDDSALADYAAWQVHLGTVDAYRYPTLTLWFHQAPQLLQNWLNTRITSRVDVTNLSQVRSGLDPRDICLVAQGWAETIDKFAWTVAANMTSYDPWRVAHLSAGTADLGEGVFRPESDGSTNSGRAETGAVTLAIATPSGPLWTTDPADYPMDLDVGGIHVTATAASGASSPQTFTVNPVPMPIPDGAAVTIWNQAVLGR